MTELGEDASITPPRGVGTVLVSYETADADVCVDIFVRVDGTFGFEEFQRDPAGSDTWRAIGAYADGTYPTADAALSAAGAAVSWLSAARERYRMGPVPVTKRRPATTPIGFWRSSQEPDLPDPHDFVDHSWDPRERDAVVAHLDAGGVRAHYKGFSHCRICDQSNGSTELTDGTFHWPAGLSHYLEAHGVRLPDVVVKSMLSEGNEVERGDVS
jgi:hypothetical protein